MTASTHVTLIPAQSAGSQHRLIAHRFAGMGGTRSAYIQAGLHADEHPGLLVVQHLIARLDELDKAGLIIGEITVCPFANPIGLGQNVLGYLTGRFNIANGENFNRNFPDIVPKLNELLQRLESKVIETPSLKALLGDLLNDSEPLDSVAFTKRHLLREALRHDVVLDLHCDTAAVMHLYCINDQRERAMELAACMNIGTVLLEDEAGGQPFDESYNKPWRRLIDAGIATPQQRGFAASIELRGQADVSDELAREDAEGILRFLAREGFIRLDVDQQNSSTVEVYPLEGASHLQAGGNGLLVWKKRLGEQVSRNELIAEIVPLDGDVGAPRLPVYSDIDGVIIVQPLFKLVRSGQRVALLAGKTPLAHRKSGQLLQLF